MYFLFKSVSDKWMIHYCFFMKGMFYLSDVAFVFCDVNVTILHQSSMHTDHVALEWRNKGQHFSCFWKNCFLYSINMLK